MAIETACQTPGLVYTTQIHDTGLTVVVNFNRVNYFTEDEAEILDANIHNALELVLAPYFRH